MSFLKNYGATLLLLLGLVAGGVVGALWSETAAALRPVGTLFLNLVFVLVVPLVFFSVARSMIVMRGSGVIGKVLGIALCVFLFMGLVSGVLSYGLMSIWNPFTALEGRGGTAAGFMGEGMNWGDALVGAVSVNDFPLLFSREHLLPLIVFSALVGLAVAALGQKATVISQFIHEGEAVVMKIIKRKKTRNRDRQETPKQQIRNRE